MDKKPCLKVVKFDSLPKHILFLHTTKKSKTEADQLLKSKTYEVLHDVIDKKQRSSSSKRSPVKKKVPGGAKKIELEDNQSEENKST